MQLWFRTPPLSLQAAVLSCWPVECKTSEWHALCLLEYFWFLFRCLMQRTSHVGEMRRWTEHFTAEPAIGCSPRCRWLRIGRGLKLTRRGIREMTRATWHDDAASRRQNLGDVDETAHAAVRLFCLPSNSKFSRLPYPYMHASEH